MKVGKKELIIRDLVAMFGIQLDTVLLMIFMKKYTIIFLIVPFLYQKII